MIKSDDLLFLFRIKKLTNEYVHGLILSNFLLCLPVSEIPPVVAGLPTGVDSGSVWLLLLPANPLVIPTHGAKEGT